MLIKTEKNVGAIIMMYGRESEVKKNLVSRGHVKSSCIRLNGEGAEDSLDELGSMIQDKLENKI